MKIASVSELKDNLSAHLEMLRGGETVVVTDRGIPLAVLERIRPGSLDDSAARLVARGVIAPPHGEFDMKAFEALPLVRCQGGLTDAILQEREDGR